MSNIKVHAGDFVANSKGELSFTGKKINLKVKKIPVLDWFDLGLGMESIPVNEIEDIDIASEESAKRIAGTVGWGAAGGVILGPVGLLAGLLLGGKGKDVTFVAKFNDGRKLLATTDNKTFIKIKSGCFK